MKNKAKVEASICNSYLVEEIFTSASHFYEPHVQSKMKRPQRNTEGVINRFIPPHSIFNYLGHPSGSSTPRYLNDEELRAAHMYVLLNCPKVDPYYK